MLKSNNEITKEEVIRYLIIRRDRLKAEIIAIEELLKCWGVGDETNNILPTETNQTTQRNVRIPKAYSPKLIIDDKILYAMDKLGDPDKLEIIAFIMQQEPTSNEVKLKRNITTRLSILLKKNIFDAVKDGPRYRYRLKKSTAG